MFARGFSVLRQQSATVNKLPLTAKCGRARLVRSAHSSANYRGWGGANKTRVMVGAASVLSVAAAAYGTALHATTTTCDAEDSFADTALFPQTQPLEKGKLKVSDVHTIAYSVYGNPKGKPVLFVHGGPGGGTDPACARFFDPKAYRIVLVDQRGCGDSTPFADLTDNTTYDSVRDFEKIRKHLGINKWQVFGGSWGSTLSIAYAVSHC